MIALSDRDRGVLSAIVQEYIETGEPVGSRAVARKYMVAISPATVRNVMSDLEEMGYLYQPHVSAGRIPTPKGFRFFLNEILELKAVPRTDRSLITRHMTRTIGNFRESVREASRTLSIISQSMAMVILPRLDTFFFKHIEFIRLDENRILVILVSKSGLVHNHIVYGEDIAQIELTKYSNYLNASYANMSIQEMRDGLVQEMSNEKTRFDLIVRDAISLGLIALEGVEDTPDIMIEGKASVLNAPEIDDLARLREIVSTFEDKGRIVRILNQVIESPGVKVLIGDEIGQGGMSEFSMIASRYHRGALPVGSLGVIGPMRMDYARVIPLVDYMAKVLGDLLEDI